MALKIDIGQRFGRLTTVQRIENDGRGYRRWQCKCDCGQVKPVRVRDLFRVKSCGCIRNECRSVQPGQKYGSLTVVAYSHRGGAARAPYFKFKCDCGNEKVLNGYRVSNGLTKSCGCLRKQKLFEVGMQRRLPAQEAAVRALFCRYRARAAGRGLPFSLDQDCFSKIVRQPCTYCGKFRPMKVRAHLEVLTLSGVDRVDCRLGYVTGNVVPCCTPCNLAKSGMTVEEFNTWAADVHAHSIA